MKPRVWVLVLLAAGVQLGACRPAGRSESPRRDVRDWSLAEIEAELQRTDDVLAREGIMIATASPPLPAPPGGEDQASMDEDDEATPPEPEPTAEPEPLDAAPATQPSELVQSGNVDRDYGDAPAERERSRRAKSSSRKEAAPSRCERVCELAVATCELEAQICELAERHASEPRYQQACERAEQQCSAAARACDRCE